MTKKLVSLKESTKNYVQLFLQHKHIFCIDLSVAEMLFDWVQPLPSSLPFYMVFPLLFQ